MAFKIELSKRALADIDEIVGYIHSSSPQNAAIWRNHLFAKIGELIFAPRGRDLAPESRHRPFEIRQTFLGKYRILYIIHDDDESIQVLTVRHGARRFLSAKELNKIRDDEG